MRTCTPVHTRVVERARAHTCTRAHTCPWKFGAAKETEKARGCDGDDGGVAMGHEREKQGAIEEESAQGK